MEHIPNDAEHIDDTQPEYAAKPYLKNWQPVRERFLLHKIEPAKQENKCATGMAGVWHAACQKGQLLIGDKHFLFPSIIDENNHLIPIEDSLYNRSAYVVNAVEQIMKLVLENGGDIELVAKNLLKEQLHIALLF